MGAPSAAEGGASGYVGRFAPSPTGELHIGSLLTAVASYLDARSHGGKWLLRIEDLDPPREVPGVAERMIATLQRYGFVWDGEIVWQSHRHGRYADIMDELLERGLAYPCHCSRSKIKAAGLLAVDGWRYPGFCRDAGLQLATDLAVRLRVPVGCVEYLDRLQGRQSQELAADVGDFVLRRADGCWAYQLAVVVDDADCGVNQIVRGADLLDSTPRQIYLQRILGFGEPHYLHLPVLVNSAGEKLSKQTLAPPLPEGGETNLLVLVLQLLGQNPPAGAQLWGLSGLWEWAVAHWTVSKIPHCKAISVEYDPKSGYKIL
ncbi:tRNA glutamyl-Q(34) synthetase GluQRS [Chitinilyticum piscinae]|uniref:Glutamyl-Q tRNA(Asp) synthetase n=1 Tax=Chitinilyticum piscinae TaxID=2866724 RepID=A0A8J7FP31_9NEIS|nr:tRNA glutamyl-Q(34) synthetase GluQRS [Chitinilyticum piscinae]MBE9609629.1 tRNA glutamyl-Q(34) synthetase GluQRS [Chitinilyticum piscinae]